MLDNAEAPGNSIFDSEGLRLITDSLPAMIACIGKDKRFRFVNRAFETRYSRPRTEIIGKMMHEILPVDVYRTAVPWIAKTMAGEAASFEVEYIADDGASTLWVQYIPRMAENGDVLGFFALIEDVSETRGAIDDLARKQASLERAQRVGNIGSWERDLVSDRIDWSVQTFAIFGLKADRGGVTQAEFRRYVHPDDLGELNRKFTAAVQSGSPYDLTHRIIRPDGVIRVVHETAEIIPGEDGKMGHLIGVIQDVTERAEAETAKRQTVERLDSLLENAFEAIISIDGNLKITLFNRGAEDLFGYRADEIIGAHVETLIPDRFRRTHGDHVAAFAASPVRRRIMQERSEIVGRRRDGSEFPAEASISKLHLEGATEMTALLRDVSQRKLQEEKLRQHQRLEAIGLLTGGVAHDFNNLLTAIVGSLELLNLNPALDAPSREMIDVALRATNRGAALTDRLLAFARQQPLSPGVTDIVQALHEVQDLARRLVNPGIEIKLSVADGLWTAMADAAQLETALLNLMINARDAMPEAGNLTFAAVNRQIEAGELIKPPALAPGPYVALSVTDTGSGISEDDLKQVLEPFFTTKEVGQGTGLGLSMVFGFAEQSNGGLDIESQVGRGTSVTIYLPAAITP
jgi:PAS domain S-box-containing protein